MFVAIDVDRTLLKENISFLFGKELFRQKYFSHGRAFLAASAWTLYSLGICSQEWLHRWIFRLIFKGKKRADLCQRFICFFEQVKDFLVDSALLEKLRTFPSSSVALFSSSPDFIVEIIGKSFGFKEAYGSQYIVDSEGNFSRLGMVMTGANKASLVQKRERPLIVYTDSIEDLPLLLIADQPIAVFPDRQLLKYARKRGWNIIRS